MSGVGRILPSWTGGVNVSFWPNPAFLGWTRQCPELAESCRPGLEASMLAFGLKNPRSFPTRVGPSRDAELAL